VSTLKQNVNTGEGGIYTLQCIYANSHYKIQKYTKIHPLYGNKKILTKDKTLTTWVYKNLNNRVSGETLSVTFVVAAGELYRPS